MTWGVKFDGFYITYPSQKQAKAAYDRFIKSRKDVYITKNGYKRYDYTGRIIAR